MQNSTFCLWGKLLSAPCLQLLIVHNKNDIITNRGGYIEDTLISTTEFFFFFFAGNAWNKSCEQVSQWVQIISSNLIQMVIGFLFCRHNIHNSATGNYEERQKDGRQDNSHREFLVRSQVSNNQEGYCAIYPRQINSSICGKKLNCEPIFIFQMVWSWWGNSLMAGSVSYLLHAQRTWTWTYERARSRGSVETL